MDTMVTSKQVEWLTALAGNDLISMGVAPLNILNSPSSSIYSNQQHRYHHDNYHTLTISLATDHAPLYTPPGAVITIYGSGSHDQLLTCLVTRFDGIHGNCCGIRKQASKSSSCHYLHGVEIVETTVYHIW